MAERATNIIDQMDYSNTQKNNAIFQVTNVFTHSDIFPDNASMTKREVMDLNRENGAKTSHDVHKNAPINYDTYHSYKSASIPLMIYAKQEYNIRDAHDITPDVVRDYLSFSVDCEIKYDTFSKNCSGIDKFCECINAQNGSNQDFHSVIESMKVIAKEELPTSDYVTRAYDNPTAIIEQLSPAAQIAAELQYTCGLRISDACYIKPSMWVDGQLTVHSKNGQYITVTPSAGLAERISAVIKEQGQFAINKNAYSYELKKACASIGEEFHGSHGLRHNFAQDCMREFTSRGMSFNESLKATSEAMGHHRQDITKVYLR